MSTHEAVLNVAGDRVGTRPISCRHGRTGYCPYCVECEEDERN